MIVREDSGPSTGETIVFVHGAGVAGGMWKKQAEALAAWRRVSVDLPDHGLARGEPFVSIEAVADEVAAFVARSLPAGKAHLVGHSLGAKVVLELLSRAPHVVASAVVSSALVRRSALVLMMNNHALNAAALWLLKIDAIARAQVAQFAFADEAMSAAMHADLRQSKAENLDRPLAAFARRLFLPPGLDRVTCPVLVTAGSAEPRVMRDSARDIATAIKGAKLVLIEGSKHNYPWSQPATYSALLSGFIGTGGRGALSQPTA